ncbi:hypothetical protein CF326_g3756 [Tilletia indica]|nr:hypothetical protein CF326_g3756 [Tilletia indica]
MTEAVDPATAALLEAEIAAIDAVARFRFTDMRIDEFGSQIDEIPQLSQQMTRRLRDVANALNEPDLVPTAFDEHPPFSHPESQSRYEALSNSQSFNAYIKSSQSQEASTPASNDHRNQSEGSSVLAPPPHQQQMLSPTYNRRSRRPSPGASTLSKNFFVGDDSSPAKRKRSAMIIPRRLDGPSLDKSKQPDISSSDSENGGREQDDGDGSFSDDSGLGRSPRSSKRVRKSKSSRVRSLGKGKGKAGITRSPSTAQTTKRPRKIAGASAAEREEIDAAAKDSSDDDEAVASKQLTAKKQQPASAISGSGSRRQVDEDGGLSDGSIKEIAPPKAKKHRAQSAPWLENGIKISKPARTSLTGRAPESKGYIGFTYLETFKECGVIKEKWRCVKCGDPKVASRQGHSSNLASHRKTCTGQLEVELNSASASQVGLLSATSAAASTTLIASSSYRGGSVAGWLNGCQVINPSLIRRLVLIDVIQNALPFRYPKSKSNVHLIKAIDARSTSALKSGGTVRKDLHRFYKTLKEEVRNGINDSDSLMALQHDAWTNTGYQHSFIAVIASYINSSWEYREHLLSFGILKKKHTGGTFSGHIIKTLDKYALADKWAGTITSDSTGTNHRMMDLLENSIEENGLQVRKPRQGLEAKYQSASSFPLATQRHSGRWTAQENKILCMNHHINLAVRAGFKAFGILLTTKTQQKVLNIRPAVGIVVTDVAGNETSLLSGSDTDDADDDEASNAPDDGDEEAIGNMLSEIRPGGQLEEEETSVSEDDDADYETNMEPSDEETLPEDGGGPGAEDDRLSVPRKPGTAISLLERFCIDVRRSSQRREQFRLCIEKEYHRDPVKASAPFPPKPNETRWNSHFAMIEGAIKIRKAIDAHCRAHIGSKKEKFGSYLLSDEQWNLLETLVPLLQLAQDVTKDMEARSGTLCMLLDNHASLRHEIESIREGLPYSDTLDENSKKELSSFLDAIQQLEDAKQHLRDAVYEMFGEDVASARSVKDSKKPKTKPKSALQATRARREKQASEENEQEQDTDEIEKYLNPSNAPWRDTDQSPLKWWKDNQELFPRLAKLARIVLAIPGSSSSSERVFSQAAQFSTNRRSRLSASSIAQLVMTKHWLREGFDPLAGLDGDARRAAEAISKIPDLT